jgi:hypothetical protein
LPGVQRIDLGSGLTAVVIAASVTVLCEECFQSCEAPASVAFEAVPPLEPTKKWAFERTLFQSVVLPSKDNFLEDRCFGDIGANHFRGCGSLESLAFEAGSALR